MTKPQNPGPFGADMSDEDQRAIANIGNNAMSALSTLAAEAKRWGYDGLAVDLGCAAIELESLITARVREAAGTRRREVPILRLVESNDG